MSASRCRYFPYPTVKGHRWALSFSNHGNFSKPFVSHTSTGQLEYGEAAYQVTAQHSFHYSALDFLYGHYVLGLHDAPTSRRKICCRDFSRNVRGFFVRQILITLRKQEGDILRILQNRWGNSQETVTEAFGNHGLHDRLRLLDVGSVIEVSWTSGNVINYLNIEAGEPEVTPEAIWRAYREERANKYLFEWTMIIGFAVFLGFGWYRWVWVPNSTKYG